MFQNTEVLDTAADEPYNYHQAL